jgi:repressor LexA
MQPAVPVVEPGTSDGVPSLLRGADTYVLRIRGESLLDEQIRDGDYIVVTSRTVPENGEMVIAILDGETTVVRTYRHAPGGRVQLESPTGASAYFRASRVTVHGIVVGLIRKYPGPDLQ